MEHPISDQEPNALCVSCGRSFHLDQAKIGHLARCPYCKKMIPTKTAQIATYLAASGEKSLVAEGRLVEDEDGFFQSVVGESHYQHALQMIKQGAHRKEGHLGFIAFLFPEPNNPYDPNAIGVFHRRGARVGYLPREDASRLRPLADRLFAKGLCIACPARLTGGTKAKPYIGVTLSLPHSDELEKEFEQESLVASEPQQPTTPGEKDHLVSREEWERNLLGADESADD